MKKTNVEDVVEDIVSSLQSKCYNDERWHENVCGGLPMLMVKSPKSPIFSQFPNSPRSLELLSPQISNYSYPMYEDNEVQVSLRMNTLCNENDYLANAYRLEKDKYYKSIVYLTKANCELE